MRALRAILFFILLAWGSHAAAQQPATPILIDIFNSHPTFAQLAGKQRNAEEVEAWLRDFPPSSAKQIR